MRALFTQIWKEEDSKNFSMTVTVSFQKKFLSVCLAYWKWGG